MATWLSQLADALFRNPEGRLAADIERWDNQRLMFDSMRTPSVVHGASPEVVVHTVSGNRYRGRLVVDDVDAPTVWLERTRINEDVSWEIARRHIEAIEHVVPKALPDGAGGVAGGE